MAKVTEFSLWWSTISMLGSALKVRWRETQERCTRRKII
jgi:hypothetical protein